MPRTQGFTLVELLVAVAVFAVVLGGVYRAFQTGFVARERTAARLDAARRAQTVLDAMATDLRNRVPYSGRPFRGTADSLVFTAVRRGEILEVGFVANAAGLARRTVPLGAGEAERRLLLGEGWRARWVFLDGGDDGGWFEEWSEGVPAAVRLELHQAEPGEVYSRLIALPLAGAD